MNTLRSEIDFLECVAALNTNLMKMPRMHFTPINNYKALLTTIFSISLFFAPSVMADDAIEDNDPIEGFNRAIFWFNDKVDVYFLEPVATGYDYVIPEVAQDGVRNFLDNLNYPVHLLSDVVQLKLEQAGVHTARFAIKYHSWNRWTI